MVKVIIDDKDYEVEEGLAIIQACEIVGVEVPRFCSVSYTHLTLPTIVSV